MCSYADSAWGYDSRGWTVSVTRLWESEVWPGAEGPRVGAYHISLLSSVHHYSLKYWLAMSWVTEIYKMYLPTYYTHRPELQNFLVDELTAKVCVMSLDWKSFIPSFMSGVISQGVKKIGTSLEMSYARIRKYSLSYLSRWEHGRQCMTSSLCMCPDLLTLYGNAQSFHTTQCGSGTAVLPGGGAGNGSVVREVWPAGYLWTENTRSEVIIPAL